MAGSSSSSSSSAAAVRRKIAGLRAQIFQTAPPPPPSAPGGLRLGTKILKARLRGPSMLQYYTPRLALPTLRNVKFNDVPMFSNYDPTETDFINESLDESLPLEAARGGPSSTAEGEEEAAISALDTSESPLPHGGYSTFETLGWDTGPLHIEDEREVQRVADNEARRARGKGPPKKCEWSSLCKSTYIVISPRSPSLPLAHSLILTSQRLESVQPSARAARRNENHTRLPQHDTVFPTLHFHSFCSHQKASQ